ncbi:ATPase AAA [Tistrella bauzanensis]|uniref:ATPase AAA n=1 Tax=Tistrella bauzanensis TaxID=657419 RepID=A0ABQ1J5U6_9PROT|nr:AAA family ATPase [Tistrella bauzanensis]GGB59443.1 ATPase AAA [Tistrella bauzanensis]
MAGPDATSRRPVLIVLAGVNGAGKSSLAGHLLTQAGLTWFNPDALARRLMDEGYSPVEANGLAWTEGKRLLDEALTAGRDHAFETTLGGATLPATILDAARTHDVFMLFCGLDSPERHIQRVRSRVAHGGHDIPEGKIRERWETSRRNLIRLMPCLWDLQVFDNSAEAAPGDDIPNPVLVLHVTDGQVVVPDPAEGIPSCMPEWAADIVRAALEA